QLINLRAWLPLSFSPSLSPPLSLCSLSLFLSRSPSLVSLPPPPRRSPALTPSLSLPPLSRPLSLSPSLSLSPLPSQFVKFANIEEDTPSYHRSYDFFVSRFSEMCHSTSVSPH